MARVYLFFAKVRLVRPPTESTEKIKVEPRFNEILVEDIFNLGFKCTSSYAVCTFGQQRKIIKSKIAIPRLE